MKTKGPTKLRVNKETLLVLAARELASAGGGAGDGKVHCCSRWTDTATNGPSTTSGSVVM